MKQVFFVVSFLLTMALQAQQINTPSEIASVDVEFNEDKGPDKEKSSELRQVKLELEAVKKENKRLQMVMAKHRNCIKENHSNHSEVVGLNAGKAGRQPKKGKSNQNTLPPPL